MLQGLPGLWRSLANSWGDSWKKGAVFGTSQLGGTACATALLTAKAWSQLVFLCTQSSSPGSVQGKNILHLWPPTSHRQHYPPLAPKNLHELCSEGTCLRLLPSRETEAAFSRVVLAAVEQG